mmetsp:Transcript_17587/g.36505  ORF Transcript_17587/g.36505 Transcript_17587/m.36505 type:complete len:231 (+) Transcript_17587:1765-2457(+)
MRRWSGSGTPRPPPCAKPDSSVLPVIFTSLRYLQEGREGFGTQTTTSTCSLSMEGCLWSWMASERLTKSSVKLSTSFVLFPLIATRQRMRNFIDFMPRFKGLGDVTPWPSTVKQWQPATRMRFEIRKSNVSPFSNREQAFLGNSGGLQVCPNLDENDCSCFFLPSIKVNIISASSNRSYSSSLSSSAVSSHLINETICSLIMLLLAAEPLLSVVPRRYQRSTVSSLKTSA